MSMLGQLGLSGLSLSGVARQGQGISLPRAAPAQQGQGAAAPAAPAVEAPLHMLNLLSGMVVDFQYVPRTLPNL